MLLFWARGPPSREGADRPPSLASRESAAASKRASWCLALLELRLKCELCTQKVRGFRLHAAQPQPTKLFVVERVAAGHFCFLALIRVLSLLEDDLVGLHLPA